MERRGRGVVQRRASGWRSRCGTSGPCSGGCRSLQHSEDALNEPLRALAGGHRLEPALACETFPQAFQAVCSGHYAALLPTLAESELPSRRVKELTHPRLTRLTRACTSPGTHA